MCSIMGYCEEGEALKTFRECFLRTSSRGPDECRILDTGKGYLGFQRLAIMGLTPSGMQPFSLNGSYVVCNGEIYGFEKQREELKKKGYTFESDSDCEILLPLYEQYGTEMFGMLDAEFACIIYDGKTGSYLAARDPIGIRPLYYGYDEKGVLVLASEAKNLVGLCEKIRPFPPGHYYKDGAFVCYHDISRTEEVCEDDVETICQKIHDKLIEGVCKRLVSDAKVGFLLSGGLDSSLVCAIAAKESKEPIRTFAIGMDQDAIDLKYARQVAEYIGSEHTEVIITKEDVLNAFEDVIHLLGTYDITTIRASIGMYYVCKYIHEHTDIRVLLTGEISDELFGYKYTDFAPSPEEFQKESEKRIRFSFDKFFSGEIHDDFTFPRWGDKTVVLLCGKSGHWLEPVGIMGGAHLHRPVLHRLCHHVRRGTAQFTAVLHHLLYLGICLARQALLHLSKGKNIFAKQLFHIQYVIHRQSPSSPSPAGCLRPPPVLKASAIIPVSDGARSPSLPRRRF